MADKMNPQAEAPSPKKRPHLTGIQSYKESEQKEIDSPFRRRKEGGLQKLTLSNIATEAAQPANSNAALEKELENVKTRLQTKKDHFVAMQETECCAESSCKLHAMKHGEINEIAKEMALFIEFKTPSDCTQEQYVEFSCQVENKKLFASIEQFINEVKDWTEEYIQKQENKDQKVVKTGWKKSKSYRAGDHEPRDEA